MLNVKYVSSFLIVLATFLMWPIFILADDPEPGVLGPALSTESLNQVRSPLYTGCGGAYPAIHNDAYEQQVVELTNLERRADGDGPLKRVDSLGYASRYHSEDMAVDAYFEHDSHDRQGGNLVHVCGTFDRVGVYYNWNNAGENIAAGYGTPANVLNAWMNSSGHRRNILNGNFWEIGVGYYYQSGTPYRSYWTQDFGKRNNVYPIVINNEFAQTESRTVTIYTYGEWDEIRFRNDGGQWSAWMPFQREMTWPLRPEIGLRTVDAEMRSATRQSSASDSINLTHIDGQPPLDVVLSGPSDGFTGESYVFTATVSPADTSQPLDYHWQATDHSPVAHSQQDLQDTLTLMWDNPGPKNITVTVANTLGQVIESHTVLVMVPPNPELAALRDVLTLTYNIFTGDVPSYTFQIENIGNAETLTWSLVSEGDWFVIDPTSGTTPAEVTLTLAQTITGSSWLPEGSGSLGSGSLGLLAQFQGALTLTVTAPADVAGSPQGVQLALNIINIEPKFIFLPLVLK